MVKNQSEDVQHPMSTFMPASTRIVDNKPVNSTFKVTKQQQNMNSLSSSTKSNKSALSTLSSLTTNSSSYRSNDGAIVVIEIGADDVGIDVGTIDDHMISTSPSSSPSSFSSSSSPNSSNSVKNTEKTENDSYNLTSHESIEFNSNPSSFTGSIHEERGIDCPEYFVPEIKQKPCYPPSLLQLKSNEQVSIIESVEPKQSNKSKTESKKSSKSKQTNDLIDSKTSQSNLLLNNADFEAEIVEQVKEKLPDKAVIQSFDNSSMRFIDDDEKLKKNLNSSNNLNHSFDNALKDNYSEFSFVSPTNNKPKIQPKPSLSLDTFECVVNELNLSNKSSVGKKLFDKQQLKEDYDKPVNKQLENVQQNFVKRNSIRKSSKQQKLLSINKNINSYDEKPIVLFNGTNEGLVNSAFSMDEICEKSAANEIRPQRPPTPPPRSDKPLSCLKTTTEESNYNLNMQTSAHNNKTCFIQEIHSSETAHKTSTTEINEIFNQINLIQCQLESTKPKQQQQQQENTEELTTQIQEMNLINNLYVAENSKNTLELYNKIISLSRCKSMKPELVESYSLVREIMNMIERISSINLIQNEEARSAETAEELNILLAKLDVKNLMLTHDKIAEGIEEDTLKRQLVNKELMIEQELQQDTESQPVDCVDSAYQKLNNELSFNEFASSDDAPVLSEEKKYLLEKASHYGVENLRLVNIEKSERPLGATIRNVDGSVVIGRIVKGGAAEKSELVHEDDEILEINNIPVRGKTINDICEMLFNTQGLVSFLIIPNMDYVSSDQLEADKVECKEEICNVQINNINNTLHIRALFNYVPQEDIYIPCKELGLAFNKGEILHVICQEDDDWWQALKDSENSKDELAGLIPSQCFQERRCSQIQAFIGDSFMSRKKRKNGFCMKGMAAKSRRRQMQFNNINDTLKHEIVTYEQVVLYKPPATCKRPIILIGPHSIGRHELRKRLMQQCPSVYEVAVPHTTRLPRREEIDGKDYHFLARHIFEADIKQGRFIEHGEYEKNLYGTSSESIRKVITNSKICVLNLYPQALKALRSSDLMPYVIFIGASNLSKLKELKTKLHQNYRENDLLDIIDKGREIEEQYGHFFDKIIRNSDMEKTYNELTDTIEKVQNEENWIPARWLQNLK